MFLYLKVNKLINFRNILEDEYFLFYEKRKNNKKNKNNKNNNVLGLFFKSFYEKYLSSSLFVMKFPMLNLSAIKQ